MILYNLIIKLIKYPFLKDYILYRMYNNQIIIKKPINLITKPVVNVNISKLVKKKKRLRKKNCSSCKCRCKRFIFISILINVFSLLIALFVACNIIWGLMVLWGILFYS
jgi:hypothetical protein